jgi:hypothetical protein
MKQTSVSKRVAALDIPGFLEPANGQVLQVSFIYQDAPTRKWAREVAERVTKVAGPESLRATWWNMTDLSHPGVLAGAVWTAMRADAIVVALDAAQELPYPFYVWVESWLPHRVAATGALMALVGTSVPAPAQAARTREFLRTVARVGRMEFMLDERKLVPVPLDFPAEEVCEPMGQRNGKSYSPLLSNLVCLPSR